MGRASQWPSNDLLGRVEARGGPKIVIFTSLSRMTRGGVASALYVLNRLERAGVGWHFTDQAVLNFDASTPKLVKDIILAVLAAVDEDYRRNISMKTKAAYIKRKALADAQGTPLKWGRRGKGKRVPPLTTPSRRPEKRGRFLLSSSSYGLSMPITRDELKKGRTNNTPEELVLAYLEIPRDQAFTFEEICQGVGAYRFTGKEPNLLWAGLMAWGQG